MASHIHQMCGQLMHPCWIQSNQGPKRMFGHPAIEQIICSNSPCPEKPEFCFEMMLEAAEKNFPTLKCHNLDLGAAIQAQSKSPVGYGSQFWKKSVLAPLLGNHPLWASMKAILDNWLQWPIDLITKEKRIGDVKRP
jgi:hypothetical protein